MRLFYLLVPFYAILKLRLDETVLESALEAEVLPAANSPFFFDQFYHTDRTHLELVIEHDGYQGERHECTTEDGFRILLHRIKPKKRSGIENKEPVLMIHGILMNAAIWLVLPPKYSLAYQLSNAGHDIWLFNSRGKLQAKGHISLEPDDPEYWNWGQDEIGLYDIPAAIDYILRVSGSKRLSIVGYSLGVPSIFLALSERPELNSKVQTVIAFAPALAVSTHGKGIIWSTLHMIAHIVIGLNLQNYLFSGQLTMSSISESLHFCNYSDDIMRGRGARPTFIAESMGFDLYSPKENAGTTYRYFCTNIGRMSWNTMIHIHQMSESGRLQRFDYGVDKNLVVYGSEGPPPYDLGKINVPTHMFYALGDNPVKPEEVTKYCKLLTSLGKDVHCIQVENPNFGHMDYIVNKEAKELVYDRVIAILEK